MAFMLDTGILMFHAESAQDLYDMILKAFVIAERPDVHLPVGVFADGFFVTHTREQVAVAPADLKLPPYDPYAAPVPAMDMESAPVRQMRDPFVMKSNFISYAAHASWQQEILAAQERARKYVHRYLEGLVEVEHPEAAVLVMASGTMVSQSREAVAVARQQGLDIGLVKIKSLRPFPREEIKTLARQARTIIVPEYNRVGWLCREIKAAVEDTTKVVGGPRVFGGMTMPPEVVLDQIRRCCA
jgi:pyruvate ferredoxin oxidoreductase alpha subunit